MVSYLCKSCNKETGTPYIEVVQSPQFGAQTTVRCPYCGQPGLEIVASCDICGASIPSIHRYYNTTNSLIFCCASCGRVE